MRFFFMGPRIFGIRPGISLGASDFRKAFAAASLQGFAGAMAVAR